MRNSRHAWCARDIVPREPVPRHVRGQSRCVASQILVVSWEACFHACDAVPRLVSLESGILGENLSGSFHAKETFLLCTPDLINQGEAICTIGYFFSSSNQLVRVQALSGRRTEVA